MDQYLKNILLKKAINFDYNTIIEQLKPYIIQWSNGYIKDIFYAGSSAKKTAIKGRSDCDIFISIKHSCPYSIKEIFYNLINFFERYSVRKQNVSVGLKVNGNDVDLVPGKLQPGNTNYHWLYKSKNDTCIQTNVKMQIKNICNSGRTEFIKLAKIWRDCHGLDIFPSVNVELTVLEALKYQQNLSYYDGFIKILFYFRDHLKNARLIDIGNSNNIISDDMTAWEKLRVAECARKCLLSEDWNNIIW
ncbi:MAG: hypothetical protein LBM19_02705 [Holosporales bacterium]|nr:hypothetical protein [Holosporales bacterium]